MKKKMIFIVLFIFGIVVFRLSFLIFFEEGFDSQLKAKTEIIVYGPSAPRGRILDCNGKIIVDNKKVNTIFYRKTSGITLEEEIMVAETLANYLFFDKHINSDFLKSFWIIKNPEAARNLITDEEYALFEERKLNNDDLTVLKYERILPEMLEKVNKTSAYIYHLMNSGYIYENKIIAEDVTDDVFAKIAELDLPGVIADFTWKRVYPYKDSLRSILGSVGKISLENKDVYLSAGYEITDVVGTSYLEYQYEDYLKGTKAKYIVGKNNELILKEESTSGKDLVLSIDIEKQTTIEKILEEKILKAKSEANTNFYKESYAIVSDPYSGAIVAMAGKRLLKTESWEDVTNNIINSSYTMGSVVKGATIVVGYQNNIIDIGTKMNDSCIKLHLVPEKCSFKKLGIINDQTALMNSSNYYQFIIAIGLTGNEYKFNMKINANENHFDIYRNTLKEFGLGAKTGIDLPHEQLGIKGKTVADDLLLNLSIGQYDTYTPIQIVQYINTIANGGNKYAPYLMKEIAKGNETILKNNYDILSKVNLDGKYIKRIQEGMNLVLMKGTGRGHVNYSLNPAGKTGTSESFYDSNNDNVNDVKTITKVFAGFIPYDNPKYSVVVISPHVSFDNPNNSHISNVNRHITRAITDFLFEI